MEEQKYVRPTWDEYFLSLLDPLSKRGTCDRGRNAAVIVSPYNTILATGYAGAPPGMPHCDEAGHMMRTVIDENGNQSQHCVRTIHGEENAILQCAKDGVRLEGAIIYIKMSPCYNCAMRILRVGIKRVVALKKYHAGQMAIDMLEKAGVKVDIIDNSVEQYAKQ
ncbi:MAG: cytidine/deoxycytidylate deaminase family protein [Candidatus Nealsonbacteria bacterium]|nr:cytidine/deoxycytidylate deaminase family protein [Candidatus Nealsonbacteria bacterium]